MTARPGPSAGDVLRHAPAAVAVIDRAGVFTDANPQAAELCQMSRSALVGMRSPFEVPATTSGDPVTEQVARWDVRSGRRREFAYSLRPVPGHRRWVVTFRDVTADRRHERRHAAIAGLDASVGAERSLRRTLDALAQQVARAGSLAGVQVLVSDASGNRLHVMGGAGFGRTADFFEKLVESRDRGARLLMLEVLASRDVIVVPGRYAATMDDPAWEPLQDYLRSPEWDWFASVPLLAGGRPLGVLNAFFAPGQTVGEDDVDFLVAMAEEAARAVDRARLLQREREVARREARQELAQDLHDSVVQRLFSLMMQARSVSLLAGRGLPPPPERLAQVADELGTAAHDALTDLRGMVVELRPATGENGGLVPALRSLLDATAARTGLVVSLEDGGDGDQFTALDPDLVEDVYRVLAEAVHNVVKHASASRVEVRIAVTASGGRRQLVAEVVDDGLGLSAGDGQDPATRDGFGMTAMRERAARWGGRVHVGPAPRNGTTVVVTIPLLASLPIACPATR
jgi:signal transduction histidine kinase